MCAYVRARVLTFMLQQNSKGLYKGMSVFGSNLSAYPRVCMFGSFFKIYFLLFSTVSPEVYLAVQQKLCTFKYVRAFLLYFRFLLLYCLLFMRINRYYEALFLLLLLYSFYFLLFFFTDLRAQIITPSVSIAVSHVNLLSTFGFFLPSSSYCMRALCVLFVHMCAVLACIKIIYYCNNFSACKVVC